jgi:uncharacterized membrane protein (UPF0127 family)
MKSFVNSVLDSPDVPHRLMNTENGAVIAGLVSTAFDSASRRRGLLGRESMPAGCALIIAPTNAIHTWFMRFDIDVAFVDKTGRILKVRHSMPPWRMFMALGAFAAVEFPRGTLAVSGTGVGDILSVEPT